MAVQTDETPGQTLHQRLSGSSDVEHKIHFPGIHCQRSIERFGLVARAWEAIQNEARPGIRPLQPR
jgi:hypothetical protein